MISTVIRSGRHAYKRVRLREMCGTDELRAATGDVAELLRGLIEPAGIDDLAGEELGEVTVSDRDRLLASLYVESFGDAVTCRNPCTRCGEPFELELSIRDLCERTLADEGSRCQRDADGAYTTEAGTRFRLPTLVDQASLAGLPWERTLRVLRERCVEHEAEGEDADELMTEVGPLLDLDLSAVCPHCEAELSIPFEISQFFRSAMARERAWLVREVHRLASCYGWSLSEILELPRSLRREHVALAEAEAITRRRRA